LVNIQNGVYIALLVVNWSDSEQSVMGFDLVKEGIANSQYDKCFKIDLWANTTNFIKADV